MADVDVSKLQEMVQRMMEQVTVMHAELRREIVALRFDMESGFRALEQRLDAQMVERFRINERLEGIGHQIGAITKRLDRLEQP